MITEEVRQWLADSGLFEQVVDFVGQVTPTQVSPWPCVPPPHQRNLGLEDLEFQFPDRFEMLRVTGNERHVVLCCGSGNNRIPGPQAMR